MPRITDRFSVLSQDQFAEAGWLDEWRADPILGVQPFGSLFSSKGESVFALPPQPLFASVGQQDTKTHKTYYSAIP
jgi:hypothetical protein